LAAGFAAAGFAAVFRVGFLGLAAGFGCGGAGVSSTSTGFGRICGGLPVCAIGSTVSDSG
jgi:hypothetical protein